MRAQGRKQATSPALVNLRRLPAIERLLASQEVGKLLQRYSRALVVHALRASVAELRDHFRAGRRSVLNEGMLIEGARRRLVAQEALALRPVLNLTGTVLHTNLGRAPLPDDALAAMAAVAQAPINLEFDLTRGA